jgi:hypothetical protein
MFIQKLMRLATCQQLNISASVTVESNPHVSVQSHTQPAVGSQATQKYVLWGKPKCG